MSTHALYQPATGVSVSSVRKTKNLRTAVSKIDEDVKKITLQISSIINQYNPTIEPAMEAVNKASEALRRLSRALDDLDGTILKLQTQLEQAQQTRAQVASDTATQMTVVAALDKDLREAMKRRDNATLRLRQRQGARQIELEKAKYRLGQHLARHPSSDDLSGANPTPASAPVEFICKPCADARQIGRAGGGPHIGSCIYCGVETAGTLVAGATGHAVAAPVVDG